MIRGFQWDLARQVERLDWLLEQLPRYADWGYQELHLHLEDAVDYPSLPGVARHDAFSWRQFERLVDRAGRAGLRVVPIANLLGHTQYLIKHPAHRHLNECVDEQGNPLPAGQLCPVLPGTLELAQKLITDLAPFATAGKIHVGLDESFLLGRHPASRREIAAIGLAGHFARYVNQLHDLVAAHGLRTAIWADMLVLLPEAIASLPAGLLAYDWYYHAFRRHPRFELFNFATYDLAPALRKQGIEYWGCPMNGAFRREPLPLFGDRLANAIAWWERGRRCQAEGMLVTSWEPFHLSPEITTAVDAAIASLWLDDITVRDHATMLQKGFARAWGGDTATTASWARLALACDDRPFSGYARWEINDRWNTTLGRTGTQRFEAEERFFDRKRRTNLPPALQLSLT